MKHAIITGITKGIGLSVARKLLGEGYHVTGTYGHDEAAAEACRRSLAALSPHFSVERADQASAGDMARFAAEVRGRHAADCLVLNAGTTLRKPLAEMEREEWDRVMQINLSSSVFLIRDLLPAIPPGSRIVFIGSLMGIHPHAASLAYGVSKAAVHALARNLVKEFEGTGTTVNAIAPGFVETEWQREKPQDIRDNICRKTALHRFSAPEEVADAVLFCLRNAYLNGSVLELSGGYDYR